MKLLLVVGVVGYGKKPVNHEGPGHTAAASFPRRNVDLIILAILLVIPVVVAGVI